MTQILILAAGAGKRFAEAGYKTPKPFLPTPGRPHVPLWLATASDCMREFGPASVTVAVPAEHVERAENDLPGVTVVSIPKLTSGAAATVLACRGVLFMDEPLIIANSDQRFDLWASEEEAGYDAGRSRLEGMRTGAADGYVLTMDPPGDPKRWSYAILDKRWNGKVRCIVEKPLVKPDGEATVGVYCFRTAQMAFDAIERMVAANDRTNGEFYLAPAINHVDGGNFLTRRVASFVPLGTPEDYAAAGGPGPSE